LLRGSKSQGNLSKTNTIGRRPSDTLWCVWRYQGASHSTSAPPGEVAGRTNWSACRRSHVYAGCLSTLGHSPMGDPSPRPPLTPWPFWLADSSSGANTHPGAIERRMVGWQNNDAS